MAISRGPAKLFPTLEASPFRSCQWPSGHPGDEDFHYCGEATFEKFSYCEKHVTMAYREPESRKDAA